MHMHDKLPEAPQILENTLLNVVVELILSLSLSTQSTFESLSDSPHLRHKSLTTLAYMQINFIIKYKTIVVVIATCAINHA